MTTTIKLYSPVSRLVFILVTLWCSLGNLKAETTPSTPPEGMRYLTIVVHHQSTAQTDTLALHLKIGAPMDLTPIWIESSPGQFSTQTVGQTPLALCVHMVQTRKNTKEIAIGDTTANVIGDTSGDTLRIYGEFCYMDCADHGASITSIDASHQPQISTLLCQNNDISTLNIEACEVIWALDCRGNKLKTLNLSQNTNLTYLYCDNNALRQLDLSYNRRLVICSCSHNQLDQLKTSKNKKLLQLFCDYNLITSLNLKTNRALRALNCAHNKLQALDIANGKNTKFENTDGFAFNAQNNPGLKIIHIDKNFTPLLSGNNIWFKDSETSWEK